MLGLTHTSNESSLRFCLRTVAGLVLANALFNVIMRALGADDRFTWFLGYWDDLFADYFKFILSYPGGNRVPIGDTFGVGPLLSRFVSANPYGGVGALAGGGLTHLHVTPLSTAYSLINLALMRWMDPELLFVGQLSAIFSYAWFIARRETADLRNALCLFGVFAVAYPTLMMVTRGNLFAGIAALALIDALLRAMRGRSLAMGAVLLAVAINIRPNAAVFLLPFLLFHRPRWPMAAAWAAIATAALGLASLLLAHILYSDYTIASFLAGLGIYYDHYVVAGHGLTFGSSLFSALVLLFDFIPWLDKLAISVAGSLYLAAAVLFWGGRMDKVTFLFATCCAYVLASTILADYHLMAFLMIVPATLNVAGCEDDASPGVQTSRRVALLATILILAPKNYAFSGDLSWQVALNPAILLAALISVIFIGMFAVRIATVSNVPVEAGPSHA